MASRFKAFLNRYKWDGGIVLLVAIAWGLLVTASAEPFAVGLDSTSAFWLGEAIWLLTYSLYLLLFPRPSSIAQVSAELNSEPQTASARLDSFRQAYNDSVLPSYIRQGDKLVYANHTFSQFIDYPLERLLELPFSELMSLESRVKKFHRPEQLLQSETLYMVKRSGSRNAVRCHEQTLGGDEQTQWVVGHLFDINEFQTRLDVLHTERDQAQLYFDTANVLLMVLNRFGEIMSVNRAGCELLGYEEYELIGQSWFDKVITDSRNSQTWMSFQALIQDGGKKADHFESYALTKNGSLLLIDWNNHVMSGPQGEVQGLVCSGENITQRRHAENRLKLSATFFDNTSEGIIVTDKFLRIQMVNRAFTDVTGYHENEVLGRTPEFLKSDRHDPHFYQELLDTLTEEGHWQGEVWSRRKNGEIYPEWENLSVVRDKTGDISHYVALFSDLSQLRRVEREREQLAFYDSLCDLPNRILFIDRLQHAIHRNQRSDSGFALLTIDLDRFKLINERLSHQQGDLLLIEVAQRIQSCVREEDTVARIGGDEFGILLENMSEDGHERVSNKILSILSTPVQLDDQEVFVGCSIGISLYPQDGESYETLLSASDTAMYHAKERGGNRFYFYTKENRAQNVETLVLETALRRAIQRDEMSLLYQPQYDLKTNRIIGLEALIRWQHPERGVVLPSSFLTLAKEIGLLQQLDNWVLLNALKQLKSWQMMSLPEISLSVNIAGEQVSNGELIETLRQALSKVAIDPQLLKLELTESYIMHNAESNIAVLHELKKQGVQLSVDDFGTGYSSLSYLKTLPIDELKIDRVFVRDLPHDQDDKAIVRTILSLAKNMGLSVTAEGVENEDQAEFLANSGCEHVQGYYYSRPVSAEQVTNLLQKQKFKTG